MQTKKTVMLLLICAALLSGCETIGWIKNDNPVNSDYACTAWPDEPTGDFTQADVASYIIDARGAYNDCSAKLKMCMKGN